MGLTESKNANEADKVGAGGRVEDDREYKIYTLVSTNSNDGELLGLMRYAMQTGDDSFIESFFDAKMKDFMYNGGKGRLESVAELVKLRNKERNAMLGTFSRKKGKGKSGPNILDDFDQEGNQGDLKKALKLLDGGKSGKGELKYREIVWKLDERGRMGENIVGACLMQGSALHTTLAIKILTTFPKIVNDIFISEDYYGLSHLHQAIVNEDPYMTNYLLQHGADVHQRCYGAFFCADDQKQGRTDSLEHEYVDLPAKTSYEGRMYFGEYPLSFAACANQKDCYRLLIAKKANPNQKDTNGNTVLHMTVIHENLEMLKLAYDTGAKLQVMNNENLTPLTLAAKIAKKKMFEQILRLESTVVWTYGEASSIAYPLAKIDTINQETGALNEDSALFLAAYGETNNHLEMLDGLLEQLLQAKWNSFARRRWAISLSCFVFYCCFVFVAFMSRPFSMTTSVITDGKIVYNEGHTYLDNETYAVLLYSDPTAAQTLVSVAPPEDIAPPKAWSTGQDYGEMRCHLNNYFFYGWQGYVRLVSEAIVLASAIFQVISEIFEIRSIGRVRWWQVLRSFAFKILYRVSLILVLLIIPMRLLCPFSDVFLLLDNMISLIVVILTSMHFLFYSRAIKFVGPFVVMVYTIFLRDMTRFLLIYAVFLFGFSQGFYIVFIACERARSQASNGTVAEKSNILSSPIEAMLRLFICTIGEFTVFYRELNGCEDKNMSIMGKIIFIIYELVVSMTQFNMLIAMMTRTYDLIYRTQKEYKRQWAQVILMTELSLPPKDRLMSLLKYSRPIGTDKRKRAFVVTNRGDTLSDSEKLMREQQLNAMREEKRMLLKRRLRDIHHTGKQDGTKSSMRPGTAYMSTPMPPRWND
uniref:Ion_trans domain-containing protein n=1 Tax=Panagrellus redivivus TaxID=6233 RepID=A0A7E4VGL2_PANRE